MAPVIVTFMADLDSLLRAISPDVWFEKVERKHLEARASYPVRTIKVETYSQFKQIIADYYAYHGTTTRWIPIPINQEWSEQAAMQSLRSNYPGGLNTAYDAARKGMNGGLSTILDAVRDSFIHDVGDAYLDYAIRKSVNIDNYDDLTRLMTEYHRRYQYMLDPQTAECPPIALVPRYPDIIKHHLRITREFHSKMVSF